MATVDDDTLISSDTQSGSESLPIRLKTTKSLRYFLEPAAFFMFFTLNLASAVFQNQIIYQVCNVVFEYSESECVLLGTTNATEKTKEIETEVQPYAAKIFMTRGIFEGVIPAVAGLFVGAWSDKYGRKPVILACFIGVFGMNVLLSVIMYISSIYVVNPWFYILAILPVLMTGSVCSLVTGVYSYIADITTNQNRAFRMALLEGSVFLGLMTGSLASNYLFQATNAFVVHITSALIVFLGIIYIVFVLKESSQRCQSLEGVSKVGSLFKWGLVTDLFKTCFEKRPHYDRAIVWLTILCLAASIFEMDGAGNVFFLFVSEKFSWTIKEYNFYDAGRIVVQIFGKIIGLLVLQKVFGFSVISLALISYASCTLDATIKAAASYPWHLYLAMGVSFISGISSPMTRTILSQVVPPSDIGKVYSLATSLESISPLISAPLYTIVYSQTLTFYPGAFYIISVGINALCYVCIAVVYGIEKCYPRNTYGPLIT